VARAVGAARLRQAARARQELEQLRLLRHTLLTNGLCDWAYEVAIRHRVAAAWVANTEGNREEAVQLMRSAADLEAAGTKPPMLTPPIALAHESLGELLLEHGEPGHALQAFETSLREYPSRLTALYGAALASELSGDRAKAQAFSRQFVRAAERVTSDSSKLARAKTFLATEHVEP
jgi:tetratricopeptide (TPR) repeat protein